MEIVFLLTILAIPIWLNAKATILVLRDSLSEKQQKVVQLIFIWLIPLIGAMVVLAIHRKDEKSSGSFPADNNIGEDFGNSGGSHRAFKELIDGD
jgi:hypothetical protein